jgi:hypothetical protein
MLAGAIAVGTQLTTGRAVIPLGYGLKIGFLQRGLEVQATGFNQRALPADTTIKIVYRDSNNNVTGSGLHGLNVEGDPGFKNRTNGISELRNAAGHQGRADTFYTVRGQFKLADEAGPEYQIAETPGVNTSFLPDSGIISRNPLVFADTSSAKRYFVLHTLSHENKISRGMQSTEMLRIQPANQWQRMGFAFHELVKYGCLSLLFLFGARLFRNFSKRDFFTAGNIRLLRNTGWLMLATQLVAVLLYFLFLQHIHPVEMIMDQNAEISSMISYSLAPGINWMTIIAGVSLLVLAVVFRDAVALQEDTILTT